MTYTFRFDSVDGNWTTEFDDLDKFAEDWTGGSFSSFKNGSHVTGDGINRITPENQETRDAVVKKAWTQEMEHQIHGMNFSIERFMEGIGAPSRVLLAELLVGDILEKETGNYVDTPQGRAFMIDTSNELFTKFAPNKDALEHIGMTQGSMSLKDTFVIVDNLAKKAIIYDTRSEAESLLDMIPRSIEKNIVVKGSEELREGFNDDGIYADIIVFGDEAKTREVIAKIEVLQQGREEQVGFHTEGYVNTKENPINQRDFLDLAYKQKPTLMVKRSEADNLETAKLIRIVPVSKQLSNAAGCKEQGIHVDFDGKGSQFVEQGRFLKMALTSGTDEIKVGSISPHDLGLYLRVNENNLSADAEFSLGL